MNHKNIPSTKHNFLLYSTKEDEVKINVLLHNETIWLSQKIMAELFNCSSDNVGLHLKNILKTEELSKNSVTEDFSVTASDGKKIS
jgi:hypothetical protein